MKKEIIWEPDSKTVDVVEMVDNELVGYPRAIKAGNFLPVK